MPPRAATRLLTGLALATNLLITGHALAGAWPQSEGRWLLVTQGSYSETNTTGYDQQGRKAGSGRYSQFEFSPYIEYGVTEEVTFGMQPRTEFVDLSYNTGRSRQQNTGLSQINLFARYAIYRWDFDVLSVQGQIGLPGAAARTQPQIAMPWTEYEARLLWGHAFEISSRTKGFLDTELGYRLNGGHSADQLRLDITLGIAPDPDWLILAQVFATRSLRNQRGTGGDYDQVRVQLAAANQIADDTWLELGVFEDVSGRKLGRARGVLSALWFHF